VIAGAKARFVRNAEYHIKQGFDGFSGAVLHRLPLMLNGVVTGPLRSRFCIGQHGPGSTAWPRRFPSGNAAI
jgi:hypothetical protein